MILLYRMFYCIAAHVNNFVNSETLAHGNYSFANSGCVSTSWDDGAAPLKKMNNSNAVAVETLSSSCAEMMQAIGRAENEPAESDELVFKVPLIPPPRQAATRRAASPTMEILETSFDGATTAVTRRRRRFTTAFPAASSTKRNTVGPLVNQGIPDK